VSLDPDYAKRMFDKRTSAAVESRAIASAFVSKGAAQLLNDMSPAIRELVVKDAKFRFASVLRSVLDSKVQKQIGIGRLHSVLSAIAPMVANNDFRREVRDEWGSW